MGVDMIDEEKIELISHSFDKFFHDMCVDNDFTPIEVSAAIQARLTRIAIDLDYTDFYERLVDLTKESLHMFGKMGDMTSDGSVH
jgi:hypothetical protein